MKLVIPLLNGEAWEVEAMAVIGDIAIHPSRKGKQWSATHLPTLLSLNAVATNGVRGSKAKLANWAGLVQSGAAMVDWIELQGKNPRPETKERIRKFCLSVSEAEG